MSNNHQEKNSGWKKKIFFLSAFFVFSLLCIIFSCLVIYEQQNSFFQNNFLWLSVLVSGVFVALFIFFTWCIIKEKEKIVKAALGIYILLVLCLLMVYILQSTGFFTVLKDAEKLQAYLEKAGAWMPIAYMILQFLQVVVLPVPGIVSTAVGVAIFGAFWTAIYSIIGIVLGSFLAFYIGRRWGSKAVAWLIGEETLKKWQTRLKGKDNLFLTLMFILPLFPDDILCFIAGLSTMSNGYFAMMIISSRVLSIYATCYSVNFIPLNTWWGITLWIVFFASIVTIFLLIYKHMDKLHAWITKKRKRFTKKTKGNRD